MSPLNSQQSCINKNSLITALWRLYISCATQLGSKRTIGPILDIFNVATEYQVSYINSLYRINVKGKLGYKL